jgi:hypothetical protein
MATRDDQQQTLMAAIISSADSTDVKPMMQKVPLRLILNNIDTIVYIDQYCLARIRIALTETIV